MLKGDLSTTPLPEVLTTLAESEATGCLHLEPADGGDEGLIYVKAGAVYAAHVPGRRPQLGSRLVSSGALPPEALEEALEAQRTELHGWRLGELLVHLGYVDQEVVSAFVVEQLRESTYDLSQWSRGTWRFRKNEKTREDAGGRVSVAELLAEAERRRGEWLRIGPALAGPNAIPVLSSAGSSAAEMTLDQDQWALLCKVDGERSLTQLARDCGFTTFEAGQVVFSLVEAGLLEVEMRMGEYDHLDEDEDAPDEDAEPMSTADALNSAISMLGGTRPRSTTPASDDAVGPGPTEDDGGFGEWADLLGEPAASAGESELGRLFSFDEAEPGRTAEPPVEEDALSRVSRELSELLEGGLEPAQPPSSVPLSAWVADEPPVVDPDELERRDRNRRAAAEELASAHAEAEREHAVADSAGQDEIEALVASLREQASSSGWVDAPPPAKSLARQRETDLLAELAQADAAAAQEAERTAAAQAEADATAAQDAELAAAAQAHADALAAQEVERATAAQAQDDLLHAQEAERAAAAQAHADAIDAQEAEQAAAAQAQDDLLHAQEAERAAAAQAQADALLAQEAERIAAEQAQADADATAAAQEADRAAAEAAEAADLIATREAEARAAQEAEQTVAAENAPVDAAPVDVERDEKRAGEDAAFAASQRRQDNDTASLLRELSSLGLDDDTSSSRPQPPVPPRPTAPPAKDPKKRKGLFGR